MRTIIFTIIFLIPIVSSARIIPVPHNKLNKWINNVSANVAAVNLGNGLVEVSESNGVPVTLTRYSINVDEKNSNADFLSYYVMKVSSGENKKYSKAFRKPVHIKDGSHKMVRIKVPGQKKTGFRDIIFGTRHSVKVIIHGKDIMGRAVLAYVENL
jgi:hypothetical protein